MKILRVITRLNIGGPSHQAQNLHLQLKKKGHDCTLVHGPVGPEEGDHRFIGEEGVLNYPELTRPISPRMDWKCFKKLCSLLSKEPFDILHTHTAKAGMLGRMSAWWTKGRRKRQGLPRLKIIHTYHGHVFSGYFGPSMTRIILGLERWLAKHTDHLITLSPSLAEEISSYLKVPKERLDIIPLGLDLDPFLNPHQPKLDLNGQFCTTKTSWIGWVGRMVPIKNPSEFLKLAAMLSKDHSDIGFVMVGDGPLRNNIEEEIKSLNLGNHVFLTGWESDMPLWMSSLDVLINTSFNEGTPVALLEAMVAGTPVLTSDVGGCRDILPEKEPATSYSSGNIQTQGHQVIEWIASKPRITHNTRSHICQQYSINRLTKDLEQLYQKKIS